SLGAMRRASEDLSAQLGAPVRINPLPAFRLRRPGRSFIVWKAFTEGRILSAPEMPHTLEVPLPSDVRAARYSYAISGFCALLPDAKPPLRRLHRKLLEDGQFLALSALARRLPRPQVLFARRSVQVRSAEAVIELSTALGPGGTIAPERLAEARRWSSPFVPGRPASWTELRDAIESVWPQANPLVGV